MGKDEWELLEKLPVKELRRQAARKCVPLTAISTAVEKSDLINLIIKAGPVLDQYDVSVGVKVWTAEAVDSHQPGEKKPPKEKDKKAKKDKGRPKNEKELDKAKKKKNKGGSSSSEEVSEQKKKKRKRSKSHKRKGKATSRSPSLTMMLPADAPLQLAKVEAGRKGAPGTSRSPSLTMVEDKVSAPVTDLEVCVVEIHEPGLSANTIPKKDKPRQRKKNKDRGDETEKTKKKNKGRSRSPSLTVTDAPPQVLDSEARKAQEGTADTAQAGVAAAAALGFNVLPKQSSYAPNAPAPGLRPSLHAPTASLGASSTSLGHRVCVQYLCFTRCDRGSSCPEAHIMDPEEEMRVRAKFKLQECNQGANCTRTSCLFRHPGERVEEASLSGSQMLQKATPQSGLTR